MEIELNTLLGAIGKTWKMPLCLIKDETMVFSCCLPDEHELSRLMGFTRQQIRDKKENLLVTNGTGCVMAAIRIGESFCVLAGPVFIKDMDATALSLQVQIEGGRLPEALAYLRSLPVMDRKQLFSILNFITESIQIPLFGETWQLCNCEQVIPSKGTRISILAEEQNSPDLQKTARDFELAMLQAIKDGQPDRLNSILKNQNTVVSAPLAMEESGLRSVRNQLICSATLASRAAMEGGLSPALSYSMSDTYILKTEEAKSIKELAQINHEMLNDFAKRVAIWKYPVQVSSLTEKAIHYIADHLYETLDSNRIADSLNVSNIYLLSRFKQETGISLPAFILDRKIDESCLLLERTDWPLARIAAELSFSSQSHFTRIFREKRLMTPGLYRRSRGRGQDEDWDLKTSS